jgi:hypothetical protein
MPIFLQFLQSFPARARRGWAFSFCLLAFAASTYACAQPARMATAPARSSEQVERSLQWLVMNAPVIFSGEVLAGESSGAASTAALGDQPASVIHIRVDEAVQGVHAGEVFDFAQWRGANGLALFPHQRVILFLHRPNAAGISSSVSGNFGLLSIGGGDLVQLRGLELLNAQRALSTGELPRRKAHAQASIWTTRTQCPQPGSPVRIELRPSTMGQKATRHCIAPGLREKQQGWHSMPKQCLPRSSSK